VVLKRLIGVRAFVPIVMCALLAACGSGGDSALPTSLPTADEMIEQLDLSSAALEDLRFIADEEGWSLEEALYRIGWQEDFSRFVQELREAYPEDFTAGGILGEAGPRSVFIAFSGAVPDEVRFDPRLGHLEVEFRESTGFSEAVLSDQVIDVHYTMRNLGFLEVGTGPDIDTGQVRVDAARRPIDRGRTAEEIVASLPQNLRADNVVIVFHPEGTVLGGDD